MPIYIQKQKKMNDDAYEWFYDLKINIARQIYN